MSEWFFRNSGRFTALLLAALLGMHGFAIAISGYYYYAWLDVVMHFWGGATVGLFFIWLFFYSRRLTAQNWPRPIFLLLILSFGAFVGVGWEFFEFLFDTLVAQRTHWPPAQLGLQDTMGDLLMDLLGAAFIGAIFIFSKAWKIIGIRS
jgi:hypothetical protein